MTIIGTLHKDGRTIVKRTDYQIINGGGVGIHVSITYPELRYVDAILQVQFDTDPERWILGAVVQDKSYANNVVGMSIYVTVGATIYEAALSTTLSIETVAIGW